MSAFNTAHQIHDLESLEALYGQPSSASLRKEVSYLHPYYQEFVEASSFVVLATNGPEGVDASPRGDPAGFVRVYDKQTLLLPDRRGNNRIDSLRNIIHDPKVALFFLVPGVGETLRVNGTASITTDPALLQPFSVNEKLPTSLLVITVERVFFQCSRAIFRSKLWDPSLHVKRDTLPSTGAILEALSNAEIDGETYDAALADRVQKTLY